MPTEKEIRLALAKGVLALRKNFIPGAAVIQIMAVAVYLLVAMISEPAPNELAKYLLTVLILTIAVKYFAVEIVEWLLQD